VERTEKYEVLLGMTEGEGVVDFSKASLFLPEKSRSLCRGRSPWKPRC